MGDSERRHRWYDNSLNFHHTHSGVRTEESKELVRGRFSNSGVAFKRTTSDGLVSGRFLRKELLMLQDYVNVLREHLERVCERLQETESEQFLEGVRVLWKEHMLASENIRDFMIYFDKHWGHRVLVLAFARRWMLVTTHGGIKVFFVNFCAFIPFYQCTTTKNLNKEYSMG
jgi:hypothetical protein